jgi:hypothetical protein
MSYWSHTENILYSGRTIGHTVSIFYMADVLLVTRREHSIRRTSSWSPGKNILYDPKHAGWPTCISSPFSYGIIAYRASLCSTCVVTLSKPRCKNVCELVRIGSVLTCGWVRVHSTLCREHLTRFREQSTLLREHSTWFGEH